MDLPILSTSVLLPASLLPWLDPKDPNASICNHCPSLSPSSKVRNIYPPLCSPLVSILRGSNGELRYPFHFENVASCHLLPPSALPSFVSEPRPTVFLMTSFNSDSPLSELSLRRRCRLRRANTCPRPTRDQSSCNGTRQSALGSRDC